MTLEQVYFVSQIMSATGVLSSLVYLSLQIHNNTRELRSQGTTTQWRWYSGRWKYWSRARASRG
jgi:hypothetical protein